MELGGPYRRPGRKFTSLRTDGFGTVYVSLGEPAAPDIEERATRYRARRPAQWPHSQR